jgi:hypothetical protein
MFATYKHLNLLGLFINYEDIEVLGIWSQGLNSLHFIFFVTYKST